MATHDLFPGFESHWLDTSAGQIFARSGGSGPPLLLVHGFPQTHVEWHKIAPELAKRFTLVLPDLPGYGWSAAPRGDRQHFPYAKRDMAKALIEVMERLGHARFMVCGHDRGARVTYRMALDHPGRIERLALIDIVPTIVMWERIRAAPSPKTEHWIFLSGPRASRKPRSAATPRPISRRSCRSGPRAARSTPMTTGRCSTIATSSTTPRASMPAARTIAPARP